MKKILILTDVPPCSNYTGGLMSSQLANMLLEEGVELHFFVPYDIRLKPEFDDYILDKCKYVFYERPIESFNSKKDFKNYQIKVEELSRLLFNYYTDYQITDVLCVVQGHLLCYLMSHLYSKTKCNYVIQIWDPIEWWIKAHGFNDTLNVKTMNLFNKVVKYSNKVITTSKQMSKYFLDNYNSSCVEVMPPVENHYYDIVKENNNKFIIGISGQIYANSEFDSLICALEKLNWKIGKKDVEIYHYGLWSSSYFDSIKHYKSINKIKPMGFFKQDMLFEQLSNLDLLYCPYFFDTDEILKKVSMLSFPSKLITYLSLNVPTLVHAPAYAAPALFCKNYDCAYVLNSNDVNYIVDFLNNKINEKNTKKYILNAKDAVDENFSYNIVKKNLLSVFNIDFKFDLNKLNILEVNNLDLPGRRFNGYDLMNYFNKETDFNVKQIVSYKSSNNDDVIKFYEQTSDLYYEWDLLNEEKNVLSVLNQLSLTSSILKNKQEFKNSDLIHYHLIHNSKLSIPEFADLVSLKPSVITIHDPWFMTGRCAYPINCNKWKNGCKNCQFLDNLFPLKYDNCSSLWKQKGKIFNELDADIIISTPFMSKMMKDSPITKSFKNVHLIPFGIDLDMFDIKESQLDCKHHFDISDDEIVLFFRSQKAMKGTEFIVEALKNLKTNKNITLLSCDEIGNLSELADKYRIIELGHINNQDMIYAYKACDIFLMPSKGESFGLMAIEAMASSRPIIIFDNTALPYVTFAPECGKLVKDQDSDDLKRAIIELIDNEEERINRGKLGRKLAEEHYDLNTYHNKIQEVYKLAYARQKNKKIKNLYNEIDYSNEDVKKLQIKLSAIAKKLVLSEYIPKEFKTSGNYINNDNIDYSNDSVMGLIKKFNNFYYNFYVSRLPKCNYVVLPVIPTVGIKKIIKNTPGIRKIARILKRRYIKIFRRVTTSDLNVKIEFLENRVNELEKKLELEMKRGDIIFNYVKELKNNNDKND